MEQNFVENDLEINFTKTIEELRVLKHKRKKPAQTTLKVGEKIADNVTKMMGSWKFIIIQSIILVFWILLNITAYIQKWDPYPFILLNLALSFQAAYSAPIIMMSQNRQADIDREKTEEDYYINLKAELEIELLHQKIDFLNHNLIEIKESLNKNKIGG